MERESKQHFVINNMRCCVREVHDGSSGGGELQAKERFNCRMDEANTLKEKVKTLSDDLKVEKQLTLEKDEQLLTAKEKLKTIAAKAVEAFQLSDEYKTVLFNWYFKGFELLRGYFVKHPTGVDLQNLDLEEVDKEMAADEAF